MNMTIASGRNEFAPPPTPGFLRALALAILAHGLLVAMLTLGVQWRRDATPTAFEAELWSAVPQEAAPPAPEVPPEPVRPALPVEPPRPVVAPPTPVHTPDADIVLAKEKARLQKEKQLREEKLEQMKLEQEKQQRERLEQEKQAKLEKEKLAREKEKQDKLDQAARDKKLQEQNTKDTKAADAAKQKAAAKTKEEAKQLEALRQQNMKRMAALAGRAASGNGDARSTGTAAQSSGPSAGYAGRIRALLKRNTTYTEPVVGNPTAEVEVRTSPDGTVISRKLVKSSGVKSWDEAVINAIDKAAVLPRDTDGRIPSPMLIVHSPKD